MVEGARASAGVWGLRPSTPLRAVPLPREERGRILSKEFIVFDWRRPLEGRRRMAVPEIKESRSGPLIAFSHGGRARWTRRDSARMPWPIVLCG